MRGRACEAGHARQGIRGRAFEAGHARHVIRIRVETACQHGALPELSPTVNDAMPLTT